MGLRVALLLVLCLYLSRTQAADYHFASIENLAEQEIGRVVLPQIYRKLGLSIKISPLPGNRAQHHATTGKKDGEIMRIWHYGIENPTTIRVPTPYYYLETMAFIRKDSGIVINSKKDLAKFRLIKIRGVKHTNRITMGLDNVYDIDSTEKMFRLLASNRADVALTNTLDGNMVLSKLKLASVEAAGKPLAILPLYHYVHQHHADMVEKIDAVIKSMVASGELNRLVLDAKRRVVKGHVEH